MIPFVRHIVTCIVSCMAFLIIQAKPNHTAWEGDGLKGKVKEVREYTAIDNNGRLKKGILRTVTKYNSLGYKTECEKYTREGNLFSHSLYIYDDSCRLVEERIHYGNPDKYIKHMCSYNESGENTGKIVYSAEGKAVSGVKFKHNKEGRLVEQSQYSISKPDKSYFVKETYKYDSKGNYIEVCNYKSGDTLLSRFSIQRNADGDAVNVCMYVNGDKPGTACEKYLYEYGVDGKIICKNTYDTEDNLKHKTFYKYDSTGNETEHGKYFEPNKKFADGKIFEYEYFK